MVGFTTKSGWNFDSIQTVLVFPLYAKLHCTQPCIANSLMKTFVRRWLPAFFIAPGFIFVGGCTEVPIFTTIRSQPITYQLTTIGGAAAVAGAAAIYYEDDLTFQVSDEPVEQGKFQIKVNKNRFLASRGGELYQVFKRRATDIAKREKCSSYTVLEYTEGNESSFFSGNRVGRGTIECGKAQAVPVPPVS